MNHSGHHIGNPRIGRGFSGTHRDQMRDDSNALYQCIRNPELPAVGTGNSAPADPLVTTVLNPLPIFNAMDTEGMPRFYGTPNHTADFGTVPHHGHNEMLGINQNYIPVSGQAEIYHQTASWHTSEIKNIPANIPYNEANIYPRSSYPPIEGMVHTSIISCGSEDDGRVGARRLEAKYRKDVKSGFKYLESSLGNSKRVLRLKLDSTSASRPKVLISAAELLNQLTIKVQEQARIIQELQRLEGSQPPETTIDWRVEPG